MRYSKTSHFLKMRNKLTSYSSPAAYPINVDGFYASYAEAKERLLLSIPERGIDVAQNIGAVATLCMHALTEAVYDRPRHGLNYINGFTYPEVKALRQTNSERFVDASSVTLNPETRDTALEFTQAWIVHANSQMQDEFPDRVMWDSFRHMGCSLTVDCLPAGISFEDLGVRPAPELAKQHPGIVFSCLEMDAQLYPEVPIIDDVTRAFEQRVINW